MRTVFKYPLTGETSHVFMPHDAKVLHVAEQDGVPCVWAEVNPSSTEDHVKFHTVGTGRPLPEAPAEHVGSLMMHGGATVLHVYKEL
ncbi:hypothetical protein NVP1009O_35 [Vibrio phage 1.009.O._10N.261.51.C9]|nr:hypothetical protein NVP1009O_35 [Vibrio phage 1.009.O._10N.261.51.C9]